MATRVEDRTRADGVRGVSARASVAGVLIASAIDDALGIGYMLSRGLAKSGSRQREGNDTL